LSSQQKNKYSQNQKLTGIKRQRFCAIVYLTCWAAMAQPLTLQRLAGTISPVLSSTSKITAKAEA
jgi:hypothetical protein